MISNILIIIESSLIAWTHNCNNFSFIYRRQELFKSWSNLFPSNNRPYQISKYFFINEVDLKLEKSICKIHKSPPNW